MSYELKRNVSILFTSAYKSVYNYRWILGIFFAILTIIFTSTNTNLKITFFFSLATALILSSYLDNVLKCLHKN